MQLVYALLLPAYLTMRLDGPLQAVRNQQVVRRFPALKETRLLYVGFRCRDASGALACGIASQAQPLGLPAPILPGVIHGVLCFRTFSSFFGSRRVSNGLAHAELDQQIKKVWRQRS